MKICLLIFFPALLVVTVVVLGCLVCWWSFVNQYKREKEGGRDFGTEPNQPFAIRHFTATTTIDFS